MKKIIPIIIFLTMLNPINAESFKVYNKGELIANLDNYNIKYNKTIFDVNTKNSTIELNGDDFRISLNFSDSFQGNITITSNETNVMDYINNVETLSNMTAFGHLHNYWSIDVPNNSNITNGTIRFYYERYIWSAKGINTSTLHTTHYNSSYKMWISNFKDPHDYVYNHKVWTYDWRNGSQQGGINEIERYVWTETYQINGTWAILGDPIDPSTTTTTTTTTTTIQQKPQSSIVSAPQTVSSSGGSSSSSSGYSTVKSCKINGICESWETESLCPSDCAVGSSKLAEVDKAVAVHPSPIVKEKSVSSVDEKHFSTKRIKHKPTIFYCMSHSSVGCMELGKLW